MATFQDLQLGIAKESTYKTGVTPTRFYELVGDESMNWEKNIVQGQGVRVGSRVARSGRRVVPTAQGNGDCTIEALSKGMGVLLEACVGAGVSTLVSGTTYQQNFTLADAMPSYTVQKGHPQVGGTVDPYTFLGGMISSFELAFPNADLVTLKPTWDFGDIATGTALATASYASSPTLYHFANGAISTGTFTAATTTALATGATPLANVRGGSVQVNHNLAVDRFNLGGGGRKDKPTVGLREITGTLTVEYAASTWRDAMLNETPMALVLNVTGGALSSGVETLQLALPEIKIDSPLVNANGTDLVTQDISFSVLDNLTAAQPFYISTRTSDSAL